MTSSIRGITRGESLEHQYIDLLRDKVPAEDKRTGDEIAADVINRLGLRFEE